MKAAPITSRRRARTRILRWVIETCRNTVRLRKLAPASNGGQKDPLGPALIPRNRLFGPEIEPWRSGRPGVAGVRGAPRGAAGGGRLQPDRGRRARIASGDKLLATLKFLMLASDSFWGREVP